MKLRHKTLYILIVALCIVCLLLYLSKKRQVEGFSSTPIPKIIWSYWNDANIPPKVEQILRNRGEVLSTWEQRVLNEQSVYHYIPRGRFPKGYSGLTHQAKSDWIRLYLLKVYGGCWMDASIIVNSSEGVEHMYTESIRYS